MTQIWHDKKPQEVAKVLKTDLSVGLTEEEAQRRLEESGANVLVKQKKTSFLKFFSNK